MIITGPFTPGPLTLTLTWADGTKTLNYTVSCVDGGCPDSIPFITGGTVKDGDKDIDAESLNAAGVIEIEFAEYVSGHVTLETENGFDVGWIGKVGSNKAVLELVKGRELANQTTYVIRGKITDAAGNFVDLSVTFVTKGKE